MYPNGKVLTIPKMKEAKFTTVNHLVVELDVIEDSSCLSLVLVCILVSFVGSIRSWSLKVDIFVG